MEILFRTKEESNREQEQTFLKLPLGNRFSRFLDLMDMLKDFPRTDHPSRKEVGYNIIISSKMQDWNAEIRSFIRLCHDHGVRMILVGGGAVNFHGYQRHSADVDFWIDVTDQNLKNLARVFREMGYEISRFPREIKEQNQNISVKFSPGALNLELITRFSLDKTFEEAYEDSVATRIEGEDILIWKVLSYDDLIDSKIRSMRPKDLLDIQELERIRNSHK